MGSGLIPSDNVQSLIYLIRGSRVMLDFDLASLYGVETRILKRAVNRNQSRFPEDFLFSLSAEEYRCLRSQIGILKRGGHAKYLPYAFAEQGVAMLSTVLRSDRAIQVNIMRAFVRLRDVLSGHRELAQKLDELERKVSEHDESIRTLFQAIRQLMTPAGPPRKPIGFKVRERAPSYRN